jgi:XTP/dITP diphosphohydrolase
MTGLIIATRNLHKLQEIRAILGENFVCAGIHEFPGAPEVVEDGETFAANASKKALAIARWLAAERRHELKDWYALADDSGLEVDALNGAPGVYSARFAAKDSGAPGNSSDAENNTRILQLLMDVPVGRRQARFRCVLALTPIVCPLSSPVCLADEAELRTELFEGVCEGELAMAPRGRGGFGYDPLFIPRGFDVSFAELGDEVKNGISHRSRALAKLRER